ncbi:MAG: Diaminopimelate decarboxylase [uncultured Thermomicrobiales bacterium]|uniref:Diaminopimelate decarboxylase n=1 Tax=uncultured Thermomicrobiales bacterium TaxID=1645740 RepID=A0A6J4VY81_9BACT|nr:MAG: Diaminopimelate decarboxylase [uncultured Thermomicrobiales bacterium]
MLWPITTTINAAGHLAIGGVDLLDLAREWGTPLYLYDEATIRERCRAFHAAFDARYPESAIVYAGKTYLSPAILAILREEGVWLDVCSGGELGLALRCAFPAARIVFHGNNKSPDELRLAVEAGIGRIIVDNELELGRLIALGEELGRRVPIALRLNPGVGAHTHEYRLTGVVDSKFGFPTIDDQAERAVARAIGAASVELLGYHCHIGAHIFELEPYRDAVAALFRFAAEMRDRHGFIPAEISPGGGMAIAYIPEDEARQSAPDQIASVIGDALRDCAAAVGLPAPRTWIEPGRALVGQAGVALYTVGAVKEIPSVRRYVAVDGGMADNIRPALYEAEYTAAIANRPGPRFHAEGGTASEGELTSRVVGKYCESGDLLIREIALPPVETGDLLALPASGAYNLAMSSNYNLAFRPAVVFVNDGRARLTRRRETLDDLLSAEVFES